MSAAEEYSFAEQVESSAPIQLSFEHFDPVRVPFDRSRTVWQRQSIHDRSVVGVEPSDEAMHLRQIICRDGRHPRVQLLTKMFGEHLRERLDMACSCFEVWAAGENLFEPDLLVVGEVVGVTNIHEVIRRTFGTLGADGGAAPILRN